MQEIDNPEAIPNPLSKSELPSGSIMRDISTFLIKLLLVIIVIGFFISSDPSNFLFSLIYFFILIYLFSSFIRDGYTIIHYYNA